MDMQQHNPKGPEDREEEKDENNFWMLQPPIPRQAQTTSIEASPIGT